MVSFKPFPKEGSANPLINQNEKKGVLLVQTGTPENASPEAIKNFLQLFLSDHRVIQKRPLFWSFLLKNKIIPQHLKSSAIKYDRFFSAHGKTLLSLSQSLTQKLYEELSSFDPMLCLRFAMRYSDPTIEAVLDDMLHKQNCSQILIIPLFPQYSHTTTGSVQDVIKTYLKKQKTKPKIKFISSFCNDEGYIDSLCTTIQDFINLLSVKPERLLLSYHGLPQAYVDQGDPYAQHCEITTAHLRERLDFPYDNIVMTFQSRFGKEKWLCPDTEQTLISLGKKGVTHVTVACPSFTMDCLETLDEIGFESRRSYLNNGGIDLSLIPCLNDNKHWVAALSQLIKKELTNWAK